MDQSTYLGKFRIIECFKKDKFFGVYLAEHIYLGKNIILKALDASLLEDKTLFERFNREAKILAKLEHPNIIKVLDFGFFENMFYISFEYFRSKTLREYIQSSTTSKEDKEKIVIQLFQALDYAHKCGIIHRDIKPENILIDESLHLKIADFGLALGTSESHITNQYSIVGTPGYMSPEQIRGEKLSEQSDLFSAGITIFELYTGKNPLLGKDVGQTINNILSKEDIKVNEYLADDAAPINSILSSLLRKNSKDRTKSAAEILDTLSASLPINKELSNESTRKKSKNKLMWVSLSAAAVIIILLLLSSFNQKKEIPVEDIRALSKNQDSITTIPPSKEFQVDKGSDNQISDFQNIAVNNRAKKDLSNDSKEKINYENLGWGKLMIECSPWADVYVDNLMKDTTPLKEEISLPSGMHLITLKHPDYPAYNFSTEINTNEISFLKINIPSLFGYLDCEVFPWGEIYLNGELKGSTPWRNEMALIPGNYKIDVKNPSFALFTANILISKGEIMVFKHNFEKPMDKNN